MTLDVAGFALRGVPGSGSGVLVSGPQRNVAIRSGTVGDWRQSGVQAIGAEQLGPVVTAATIATNTSPHASHAR